MALNFLSLISGVATITKKFVDKVKGKSCKICCTRKTVPNLRSMHKNMALNWVVDLIIDLI